MSEQSAGENPKEGARGAGKCYLDSSFAVTHDSPYSQKAEIGDIGKYRFPVRLEYRKLK